MATRAVNVAAVLLLAMSCSCDGDDSSMSEAETSCALNGPVVVASGTTNTGSNLFPDFLQVDDEWVYFDGPFPVGLYRVSKNGGSASLFKQLPEDFFDSSTDLYRYAIDATTVYFMLVGRDLSGFDGRVLLLNKDGSERGVIEAHQSGDCRGTHLRNIALGGDGTLYWAQGRARLPHDDFCLTADEVNIIRVLPGETAPTIIATLPGNSAAGESLVADRTHVFWTDNDGVWRLAKGGGAPERLLGPQGDCPSVADCGFPFDLAIDFGSAYFTSRPDGQPATYRIPAPGVATLVHNDVFEGLISDGTYLYGSVRRTSPGAAVNVMRIKPNGHGLRFLGKSIGFFRSVAVDETFVYFPSPSGLEILKACKSG